VRCLYDKKRMRGGGGSELRVAGREQHETNRCSSEMRAEGLLGRIRICVVVMLCELLRML
jgi:hypothetical protein